MVWDLKSGCKVNLYLDITGVRDNGYHEIASLFYPLPWPCDHIRIETGGAGFDLSCSDPVLETSTNILWRTYQFFAEKTGFAPNIKLHLQKNIPMGAGLGGGSSNAAIFLLWLHEQAGDRGLDQAALESIAVSLGADVPFFLKNTPAWVTGIGEQVAPVACNYNEYVILVICAPIAINTAWAYGQWDQRYKEALLQRKGLTHHDRTTKSFCFTKLPVLWNCFEEIIFAEFPLLGQLKDNVLAHHADACGMSGSGPSLVAFFSNALQAVTCASKLQISGCACFVMQNGQPIPIEE
ncbi:MAG: 4-(cytidine 5'-diphospho)-2-C-methyl-D-erythritol kinase [Desulfovibrionales bacterium]|nr:4-(cytidine 5'-diphospho)-2-C-methyl-D-erythritol kinase [Desulfovibrionales bacterium]